MRVYLGFLTWEMFIIFYYGVIFLVFLEKVCDKDTQKICMLLIYHEKLTTVDMFNRKITDMQKSTYLHDESDTIFSPKLLSDSIRVG